MFDVATKTTDIIMFNSRNLGALIVDEKSPRQELGRTAVLDPEPRYRRELRVRCAQRRSGNRRREERQGPPERDVDAGGVDHLHRAGDTVFQAPSGLVGAVLPFDRTFTQ